MPTPARPRPIRATIRAVTFGLATVALSAAPAAADPAGPGDFRSEVTGVIPDLEGLSAEIVGGDAFLELRVPDGREVIVEGYQGEPYLRFREDGTVEQNRLSSATYLNDDRKAQVEIPAEVQAAMESGADPDWEEVADGGTYAWHDHRVHWMAEVDPPVARGERVTGAYDPWRVPLLVDGDTGEVQGILTYASTISPLPWAAVALAVLVGVGWLGRGRGLRLPAVALVAVSAVAAVVGRADWAATPDGQGNPLLWLLPVISLVAAACAAALARRSTGVILALAAVACLSAWALFRFEALLEPILPTDLPYALDRATVAVALAISAAAAYLAITEGTLSLPSLDDDE